MSGSALKPLPPTAPRSPSRPVLSAGSLSHVEKKPLVYSFFGTIPQSVLIKEPSGGRGGSNGARRGSGHGVSTPGSPHDGAATPKPMTCSSLFLLSPGVREKIRVSSHGSQLSETESLHLKHVEEYNFLVVTLAYALQQTLTAHERLYEAVAGPQAPSIANSASDMVAFNTPSAAALTILDYLKRVVKYTYTSPSALLVACIYLDRLLCRYPALLFHSYNCLKLILSTVRIASKVLDTRSLNNKDFAVVGGISNEELNKLESLLAERLEFDLYVSQEEFYEYGRDLIVLARGEAATPSSALSPSFDAPSPPRDGRPGGRRGSLASARAARGRSTSLMSQNGAPLLQSAMHPADAPFSNSLTMTRSFFALDEEAEEDDDAAREGAAAAAAGAPGTSASGGPRRGSDAERRARGNSGTLPAVKGTGR